MGIVTHMMYTELSNNNNNNDEPEKKKKKKRRHRRGKTSGFCNCKLLIVLSYYKGTRNPYQENGNFVFIFAVDPFRV
jgi:hypothetical protein